MIYEADIKSYDPDFEESAVFDTQEKAERWLSDRLPYHKNRGSMWLNGKSVYFWDGHLVEHKLDLPERTQTEFDRIFRLQSARPTNPATLKSEGAV